MLNQIWQSANFLAKALFLILLTPLMLKRWGGEGYGLFALSSSLLVSLALVDCGVRALTRLRLAEALKNGDDAAFRRHYSEGLYTFLAVCFIMGIAMVVLAGSGYLTIWLRLPKGGTEVLTWTFFLTAILMTTTLALEPLAAHGKLSTLKAVNTWGALAAIPACAIAVWFTASVGIVIGIYAVCLIVPNLIAIGKHRLLQLTPWKEVFLFEVATIFRTLREGFWFYLTTLSLIIKTHGLTFLVSSIAGPAEAGIFYILLRLTEIIGNVGATASETSLASLASANTGEQRAVSFRHSWIYTAVFCLYGALAFTFLGDHLLHFWLRQSAILPVGIGWALAIFGLTAAFSRVVVNAAMGLPILRQAACANWMEALLDVALAALGYHLGGLPGLFVGASVGIFFLLWPAVQIARLCDSSVRILYVYSLFWLVPGLAICAILQAAASFSHRPVFWFLALAISAGIALLQLRKIHTPMSFS